MNAPVRFVKPILWGALSVALLPGTGHVAELGTPQNGTWRVCCDDFFPPTAKRPHRPLPIYVICRDGKFLYGLGSAPDWNTTAHPADVSALRYDAANGKLAGTLQVKLNPDPWVPADGKAVTCSYRRRGHSGPSSPVEKTALQGTYRGRLGTDAVQGRLSGYVYNEPLVDLANCQLTLTLNQALLGGRERYQNRLCVRFDVRAGRAAAAEFGLVGLDNRPYDFRPFERVDLRAAGDEFRGDFTVPYEVLGAVGDPAAEYTFRLEGRRFNNLCGGEFTVQVAHAGQTSSHAGNFKGSINPPVAREVSIWEKDLKSDAPWFVPVPGHHTVKPGEHPRLLFRRADCRKSNAEPPRRKAGNWSPA